MENNATASAQPAPAHAPPWALAAEHALGAGQWHGAWRTLLDDPTSYPETSATAGFAYGLMKGARLGVLGPDAAEAGRRALGYVMDQIGPDGAGGGVSYGTRMGHDLQFYRDIPIQPTGYGQSLAMLALVEALKEKT